MKTISSNFICKNISLFFPTRFNVLAGSDLVIHPLLPLVPPQQPDDLYICTKLKKLRRYKKLASICPVKGFYVYISAFFKMTQYNLYIVKTFSNCKSIKQLFMSPNSFYMQNLYFLCNLVVLVQHKKLELCVLS